MKLVFGIGHNDTKGESTTKFYKTWASMLERCYSSDYHKRQPTYVGCSVCEDWLTFSKFKAWMETQDWEGKHLDKDIIFPGNKVYSPKTCVFVSQELNKFLNEKDKARGQYPIGVSFYKINGKFLSQCNVNGRRVNLGYFDDSEAAHKAWLSKKVELAGILAMQQKDERIVKAIIEKYRNYEAVGEVK